MIEMDFTRIEGAGDDGGDTIQDMIVVVVKWDKENAKFMYTYYHYLPATLGCKNDVTFVGTALYTFFKDFSLDNPKHKSIQRLIIWSDGGAAHYKQRFALGMMLKKQLQWNIKAEWNFWVSNHGHNVCDSAASVLKRTQRKVFAKNHISLETPEDFARFIQENLKSVHHPHLIEVAEQLVGLSKLEGLRLYHKFVFNSSTNVISAYPSSLTALEFKNVKCWTVDSFEVRFRQTLFILTLMLIID
jgi:hypothetical protein